MKKQTQISKSVSELLKFKETKITIFETQVSLNQHEIRFNYFKSFDCIIWDFRTYLIIDLNKIIMAFHTICDKENKKSYKNIQRQEIIEFYEVNSNFIKMTAHLKEFNGSKTDYNALAQLVFNSRGIVAGKRFGI